MSEQGSIAITARGDNSRWYGRLSIPQSVAAEANITAGMRVSTKCATGFIIIFQDENGRIKFPSTTGKGNPRHAFEAATTTLGLKEVQIPQASTSVFVKDGRIHVRVPEECVATEAKARKRVRKEEGRGSAPSPRPILTPVHGIYGASAAVVIEANRAGKKVRPMNAAEVIGLLNSLGRPVVPLGPRLFNFEGRSCNISDLLEAANKATVNSGEGLIILEMKD